MKRVAASDLAARAKSGTGVLYLARALHRLDAQGEFVVEADETDYTKWSVGIPAKMLHGVVLRRELNVFAQRTRHEPMVMLRVVFPRDFPESVPYARVVRPRFVYQTGHVTNGGAFCTELLAPQGWRPMTVDALLHSLILTLDDGGARIQLEPDVHCATPSADYDEAEASDSYRRALRTHGWK